MKKNYLITSAAVLFFTLKSIAQIAGFNVDVLPTNIGGKTEFKRVFDQELIYPANALSKKTGGKTIFNFVVRKDSTLTNIEMKSSGTPELDAEAKRLLQFYKWVPAIKSGQYVNTNWSAEFDFNPDKYAKICKERGFVKFDYLKDAPVDTSGKIYTVPDQIPMYQQGNFALQDFIKANLEYPRQASVSNIQGTVMLRFIVEPSGLMTNIGIEKSIGGGCDQEAIRVLQLIKWYPGKAHDQFVRVQMSYPFYFILNEDFKDNSTGSQK